MKYQGIRTLDFLSVSVKPSPEVINFIMLISAEHEILNAHKYKILRNSIFKAQINLGIMLLFLLINAEMPTIVGILTFMSRKKFMLT